VDNETSITRILRAAIPFQDKYVSRVPLEKRRAGEGRICKLVVDDPGDGDGPGPNHTIIYFQVKDGKIAILDEKPKAYRNEVIFIGMANDNYTGVDLFMDGLRRPGIFRRAYAEKWLIITDPYRDLDEYDSEEMLQLCEDLLHQIAKNLNV
jgi:hypothetical protein